jgi:origin recognition complex subunit 1
MKLTTPGMAYSYLWYKLNNNKADRDKKKNPAVALIQLGRYFAQASKQNSRMSVILLDEMDYLLSRDNNVIYNFMEWTQQETSRLYVIGIANTMNLPEQLSQKIQRYAGSKHVLLVLNC